MSVFSSACGSSKQNTVQCDYTLTAKCKPYCTENAGHSAKQQGAAQLQATPVRNDSSMAQCSRHPCRMYAALTSTLMYGSTSMHQQCWSQLVHPLAVLQRTSATWICLLSSCSCLPASSCAAAAS
jgi:hypothetical protein